MSTAESSQDSKQASVNRSKMWSGMKGFMGQGRLDFIEVMQFLQAAWLTVVLALWAVGAMRVSDWALLFWMVVGPVIFMTAEHIYKACRRSAERKRAAHHDQGGQPYR